MYNDPELDGKYLGVFSEDFIKVSHILKEAAYELKRREISDYPIFPVAKEKMAVGSSLIDKGRYGNQLYYHFSFLEAFIEQGLVDLENRKAFEDSYRDISEFCCLFVVDKDFIKFIYIPYPEEEQD